MTTPAKTPNAMIPSITTPITEPAARGRLAGALGVLLGAAIAGLASAAQAASFDCAKAGTWVEHAVCGDPGLSAMDERIRDLYWEALGNDRDDTAAREATRDAQRAWLAARDNCESIACITRHYNERIRELLGREDAGLATVATLEEQDAHWSIRVHYPRLALEPPADERARQVIAGWVEQQTADFRQQAREMQSEPGSPSASLARPGAPASAWQGPDWTLEIDYGAIHQAERFIAIPFSGYVYTGGAHGMPIGAYVILDRASGERIPVSGLFAADVTWLPVLSTLAREALANRDLLVDDPDWLARGTAPQAANYQLLFPAPDGLRITFLPYTVAPYAAGIQDVLIPYGELHGLLNPDYFAP